MSTLRYDGRLCGLLGKTDSGNVNDPANTMLVCICGADLGPLARFLWCKGDDFGRHVVGCPGCKHMTVISGDGRILKVAPLGEFLGSLKPASVERPTNVREALKLEKA